MNLIQHCVLSCNLDRMNVQKDGFFVALPCVSISTFVKNSPLIPLNSVPLRTSSNFGRHEGKLQRSFLPVQDPFSPGTRKYFQHNFSVPFDLFFFDQNYQLHYDHQKQNQQFQNVGAIFFYHLHTTSPEMQSSWANNHKKMAMTRFSNDLPPWFDP